jgi:hypothetical protein
MEDKNNNNDFEQFLRSSIEDFKMIPSRKIWYGIYNNMHPDRKWPSIAVCLIILTAVMFVGVANNNSISSSARKNADESLLASTAIIGTEQNKLSVIAKPAIIVANFVNIKPIAENVVSSNNNASVPYTNPVSNKNTTQYISSLTENKENSRPIVQQQNEVVELVQENTIEESNNKITPDAIAISVQEENKNIQQADAKMIIHISNATATDVDNNFEKNTVAKLHAYDTEKSLVKSSTNITEEKLINEVNISKNNIHSKKLKENGSMLYYLTPSIGYRNITSKLNNGKSAVSSNSFGSSNIGGIAQENMKDAFALNVEVGAVFQYKVSKNVRFKTGLQANYTNYVSNVTALDHPTQTTLAVTGQSNNYRSSSYATREGNTHLNKTTWQVALPIGVDIKLAGNDKLQWYVGATAQPTYVLGGGAFVLSADERYYIAENALVRKWNLNTAVETFVSFKPSSNVTLNVGPQFRYQVFSSYKKAYNYSEKLYNVGVKIGLITNF